MSTNREQHELAAKAAGLAITWKEGHCKGGPFEGAFVGDQPWRPKDDDGDSRRLEVKLGLTVCVSYKYGLTWADKDDKGHALAKADHDGDPYAATRLAIFRAAVEIGRSMP